MGAELSDLIDKGKGERDLSDRGSTAADILPRPSRLKDTREYVNEIRGPAPHH